MGRAPRTAKQSVTEPFNANVLARVAQHNDEPQQPDEFTVADLERVLKWPNGRARRFVERNHQAQILLRRIGHDHRGLQVWLYRYNPNP